MRLSGSGIFSAFSVSSCSAQSGTVEVPLLQRNGAGVVRRRGASLLGSSVGASFDHTVSFVSGHALAERIFWGFSARRHFVCVLHGSRVVFRGCGEHKGCRGCWVSDFFHTRTSTILKQKLLRNLRSEFAVNLNLNRVSQTRCLLDHRRAFCSRHVELTPPHSSRTATLTVV